MANLVEKLDELAPWLDNYLSSSPGSPLAALQRILSQLDPNLEDVQAWLMPPGDKPYGRKLVWVNQNLECLVMNWAEGVPCAPHDHGQKSVGLVKLLQGASQHTIYTPTEEGLKAVSTSRHQVGEILQVTQGMIHGMESVGNPKQDGSNSNLVSFHLYSPPIHAMQVFDLQNQEVLTVADNVGAWIPAELEIAEGAIEKRRRY